MKRQALFALILSGASTLLVSNSAAQDASAGKSSFNKCLPCHAVGEDAKSKAGPQLNGLDGRKVGGIPDYSYSAALKSSGVSWDEAQFKEFIQDPKTKFPGTKMMMAGIKKNTEVNDLWAYVKQYDKDGKVK
ncbi:c-type cytochrome [Bradyrhizobium sp. B120]|uniref:c-type cytochrome n=1 Tax=Bradyrhizobium sp. B120 TaxID=3410088 RepID=UPI003B982125